MWWTEFLVGALIFFAITNSIRVSRLIHRHNTMSFTIFLIVKTLDDKGIELHPKLVEALHNAKAQHTWVDELDENEEDWPA